MEVEEPTHRDTGTPSTRTGREGTKEVQKPTNRHTGTPSTRTGLEGTNGVQEPTYRHTGTPSTKTGLEGTTEVEETKEVAVDIWAITQDKANTQKRGTSAAAVG
jgi:hypothetical protein